MNYVLEPYEWRKLVREGAEGDGLELSAAECADLLVTLANPSGNDDPEDVAELLLPGALKSLREMIASDLGVGVPLPHEEWALRWFGCVEDAPRMGGYAVRITEWGRDVERSLQKEEAKNG